MGKKIYLMKTLFLAALFIFSYILGGALLKYPDVNIITEETAYDDVVSYIPSGLEKISGKININTASAQTLQELDGIGEKLSQRIVNYRSENGQFDSVENIMDVPGFGYEKFKNVENFICAKETETVTLASVNAEEETSAVVCNAEKININTATVQELQELDGIGEKISRRIVDYRSRHGAFNTIEEIKNVSGIGNKRFDAIKDNICIGE